MHDTTPDPRVPSRAARAAKVLALCLASAACATGALSLAVEARFSFSRSFADRRGLAEATFLFLRFFTILTNIGLVLLQGVTAWRLARDRPLPAGRLYDAALVYAIVTGATYELLLRSKWHPAGLMFPADIGLHDVAPSLMLAVWLLVVPRGDVRWRDPFFMLVFPAAYLSMTLVAGSLGEGYPYDFLDVGKIGLPAVLLVSLAFLALFLALGFAVTAAAKRLPG